MKRAAAFSLLTKGELAARSELEKKLERDDPAEPDPLKDPAYSVIYEYACHEGNYSPANILKAARAEEKKAKGTDPRK